MKNKENKDSIFGQMDQGPRHSSLVVDKFTYLKNDNWLRR